MPWPLFSRLYRRVVIPKGKKVSLKILTGNSCMTKVTDLHQRWMANLEYQKAYESLASEFEIINVVIASRICAELTRKNWHSV